MDGWGQGGWRAGAVGCGWLADDSFACIYRVVSGALVAGGASLRPRRAGTSQASIGAGGGSWACGPAPGHGSVWALAGGLTNESGLKAKPFLEAIPWPKTRNCRETDCGCCPDHRVGGRGRPPTVSSPVKVHPSKLGARACALGDLVHGSPRRCCGHSCFTHWSRCCCRFCRPGQCAATAGGGVGPAGILRPGATWPTWCWPGSGRC
jgi:hypothetical protein